MTSLLVCSVLAIVGQAAPNSPAEVPSAASDVDRAEETVRRARTEAQRYEIVRDDDRQARAELHDKPILKWSNPSEGSLFGSVVLWTVQGRPEAVASIYRWYGDKQEFHAEIKSLSTHALKVTRNKETTWDAQPADVKFQELTHEAPAASEAGRLRQMRDIARRFAATLIHPRRGTNELRLLPQPVYRYDKQPEGVVDGGLFAFVQGTDPEVFILVEAEKTAAGMRWRYAVSRMNMHELHLSLDGKEVWSAGELTWNEVSSRRGPYAILLLEY
jgi:hypothetical protein